MLSLPLPLVALEVPLDPGLACAAPCCSRNHTSTAWGQQTDKRPCKQEELFLALAHIENKLVRAWLRKFDGRKKVFIDSIAMLCEHHVSDNYHGYATRNCSMFMDSLGARDLAVTGAHCPPSIVDCPKRKQDITGKVSWPAELSIPDQVFRPGNEQTLHR